MFSWAGGGGGNKCSSGSICPRGGSWLGRGGVTVLGGGGSCPGGNCPGVVVPGVVVLEPCKRHRDWERHRHKEGESGITAKERENGRD